MRAVPFAALALSFQLFVLSLHAQTPPAEPPPEPKPTLKISGGIYLFEYAPLTDGAKDKFEIYAFILNGDAATGDGQYGLHVQGRARDSKLRPFFLSNVWFQEAYVWAKTPVGEAHAGKFYRKVGILWDDSFFGNVQYFNGLKLNPDYGIELVGRRKQNSTLAIDYSAQYFNNNDKVDGSLDGRDVESDPDGRLAQTFTGRLVPTWTLAGNATVAVGLSALTGRIDRDVARDIRLTQVAGDVTWTRNAVVVYAEALKQNGADGVVGGTGSGGVARLGYRTATYLLAGTRWQVTPRVNARVSWSEARYAHGDRESEIVPGIVITLHKNIYLINELDYWRTGRDGHYDTIDKSLNFVLNYNF